MALEEQLADAFDAWSHARAHLGELRKKAAGTKGPGQLAQSVEAANLYREIAEAEATCQLLFRELTDIAEKLADEREQRNLAHLGAQVLINSNKDSSA
jgi:hypothetical protein